MRDRGAEHLNLGLAPIHGVEFDRSCVSFELNGIAYPVMSIRYGDGETVRMTMRSSAARRMLIESGGRGTAVVGFSHPEIGDDSDQLEELEFVCGSTAVGGDNEASKSILLTLHGKCARVMWTKERIKLA